MCVFKFYYYIDIIITIIIVHRITKTAQAADLLMQSRSEAKLGHVET